MSFNEKKGMQYYYVFYINKTNLAATIHWG